MGSQFFHVEGLVGELTTRDVMSSALRDIQAQNHFKMSDTDLTRSIASEAIEAGLNIHFDGPNE